MFFTDLNENEQARLTKLGEDAADIARVYLQKDSFNGLHEAVNMCEVWLQDLLSSAFEQGLELHSATRFFFPNRVVSIRGSHKKNAQGEPDNVSYSLVGELNDFTYRVILSIDNPVRVVCETLRQKLNTLHFLVEKQIGSNYVMSKELLDRLGIKDELGVADFDTARDDLSNFLEGYFPSNSLNACWGYERGCQNCPDKDECIDCILRVQ